MEYPTRYINYHKHTHYSNIRTIDTICKPEEYIKRALELGHKEYVTTEHGFQGNFFEAFTLCQKYGIKCIYGVEAYYVDDMFDTSDRTNYHICLIALTQNAQEEINSILSKANTEGYYYKPRIDLNCLLSLTPSETIVTTACVASRLFKGNNWEEKFFIPVYNHFKDNLYLEVQAHNAPVQIEYNKKILKLRDKYNVKIIHANDSHYIYPEDSKYRDLFLKAKGVNYPEESNFILDYPDIQTIIQRYKMQGVLSENDIIEALNSTLCLDKSEGIFINKEFKIPKINPEILKQEFHFSKLNIDNDDEILKEIIKREWSKEKGFVKAKLIPEYEKAIYYETDIIKKCGMARYFILDYIIVKRAIEKYNAVLTRSGRGSAVSFYINKLLGLTKVDRIKAPIKLYPTRFMSAERILQSRSLPDIDLNWADTEPVVQASKDILGDDGIYFMVSFKPLQESSAFRLWCKANNYIYDEYNEVGKNLDLYREDKKWGSVIKDSEKFIGVIESVSPSSCSYLLSSKPISKEVSLLKVGDLICCNLDGYNCDYYKYLKNDYLIVTVWKLISETYKLINKPIDDIATLVNNCDDKVWNIYKRGLTTTINQVDSDFAKPLVMKYQPQNLSELSAFVAAIRPAFSSLLDNFLNRKSYSTGVGELDNILSDSFHYLLYQESIMSFLVWLGIEEKVTYDIIKKISKKKFTDNELYELKATLIKNWKLNVGTEDGFNETWKVVEDAAHYAFNASHSLSVAIDSLYGAYLKSHYPLEYFTVALSLYSDDMIRTSKLISELPYFNIKLKPIKFGMSGSDYTIDKENNTIYKGIASIKYCNSQIAEELLELSKNKYNNFFELLSDIKLKTKIDNRQLKILIGLNFFSDFGNNKKLLKLTDIYNGVKIKSKTILPSFATCSQISKSKIDDYKEYGISEYLVKKYSGKETPKQYSQIDNSGLLNEIKETLPNDVLSITEQIKFELDYLEYTDYKNSKISNEYYVVVDYVTYKDVTRPSVVIHRLNDGKEYKTRIKESAVYKNAPFDKISILKIPVLNYEFKKKYVDGKWITSDETELILKDYEVIK